MNRATVFLSHSPSALAHYYGARALAALQALATVRLNPGEDAWTVDSLSAAAQGCDIIVSDRRAEGSAELLARLPRLVAFCRCAVDIRNVDVAAANANGILVTHASAGFMASVSEWIVGAMVDLSRHLSAAVVQYRAGSTPLPAMGRELRGATLGIIGYGQIGRYLADVARALGMRLLVADPYAIAQGAALRQVRLDELLAEADFVVCLAAASAETESLMNGPAFAAMKPGAFFINAARGDLVDEAALLHALDSGRLAGCALDVGRAADQMPSPALARHPRVIATPHIGGLTPPAIEHQSMETVRQVADLVQGIVPLGAVNAASAHRLRAFFDRNQRDSPMPAPMPRGACDCHIHVYEERYPLAPTATFKPPPAPVSAYRKVQQALGLERVVLVQPTGYGFDNACLLDALAQLGDCARGIVVVPADTSDAELERLHAAGVRGLRYMMLAGAGGLLGWDTLERMAARIARLGWIIDLQLDGRELPRHRGLIDRLPGKVVIDHTGKFLEPVQVDDAAFKSLQSLLDRDQRWVKLSAPYETSKSGPPRYDDVAALARALVVSHPRRCLWASNWPHPNRVPAPDDAQLLALLSTWAPDEGVREAILAGNAAEAFGFGDQGKPST